MSRSAPLPPAPWVGLHSAPRPELQPAQRQSPLPVRLLLRLCGKVNCKIAVCSAWASPPRHVVRTKWTNERAHTDAGEKEARGSYFARGLDRSGWEKARNSSPTTDRKSTRLNSSHLGISYAVFCLKK